MQLEVDLLFHVYDLVGPEPASAFCTFTPVPPLASLTGDRQWHKSVAYIRRRSDLTFCTSTRNKKCISCSSTRHIGSWYLRLRLRLLFLFLPATDLCHWRGNCGECAEHRGQFRPDEGEYMKEQIDFSMRYLDRVSPTLRNRFSRVSVGLTRCVCKWSLNTPQHYEYKFI